MAEPRSGADMARLSQQLRTTTDMVERLTGELRGYLIAQTTLEGNLREIQGAVSQLTRVIRDGDGGLPLMTRIALIEHRLTIEERTGQSAQEWWWKLALNIGTALILAGGSAALALYLGKKP